MADHYDTHTHKHKHIYIYIYIYVCVCVCVCVCLELLCTFHISPSSMGQQLDEMASDLALISSVRS